MSGTIELFRNSPETLGRDRFSCSAAEWKFLQEVATTFGWRPAGATYEIPPNVKIETPARHDYRPGDAADRKLVEAEDAMSWARSLERATHSENLADIIRARVLKPDETLASLQNVLKEFTVFAYGGSFTFAHR